MFVGYVHVYLDGYDESERCVGIKMSGNIGIHGA
jgi:hypothetical protein